MNLKHFLLVFALVISVLLISSNFKIDSLVSLNKQTSQYNETIDTAVDDTLNSMLEVTDSFSHVVDLEKCSHNFFRALFAGFNLADSRTGQAQLSMYVPILLVTDEDGFYVMYHSISKDKQFMCKQWTPKMPYCYSGKVGSAPGGEYAYTLSFTMSNRVRLNFSRVGSGESSTVEGNYNTLEQENPNCEELGALQEVFTLLRAEGQPLNDDKFEKFRKSVMVYQITKKANYYVNKHNSIAEAYGISYEFSLPESSTDSFARTIEDVSLMAIFQGYPYGKGTSDVYSRFSVSGARLHKSEKYYIVEEGGIKYYHRASCSKLNGMNLGQLKVYESAKECAKQGAYPCQDCNP